MIDMLRFMARIILIVLGAVALSRCADGPVFDGCTRDGPGDVDAFYVRYKAAFGDDDGRVRDAFRSLLVECRDGNEDGRLDLGNGYEPYGATYSATHIVISNSSKRSTLNHELMHAALMAKDEPADHPWPEDVSAFVFELYGHAQ